MAKPAPKFGKTIAFLLLAPVILGVVSIVFFVIFGPRPPVPIMLIAGETVLFVSLLALLNSDGLDARSIGRVLPEGRWRKSLPAPVASHALVNLLFILFR